MFYIYIWIIIIIIIIRYYYYLPSASFPRTYFLNSTLCRNLRCWTILRKKNGSTNKLVGPWEPGDESDSLPTNNEHAQKRNVHARNEVAFRQIIFPETVFFFTFTNWSRVKKTNRSTRHAYKNSSTVLVATCLPENASWAFTGSPLVRYCCLIFHASQSLSSTETCREPNKSQNTPITTANTLSALLCFFFKAWLRSLACTDDSRRILAFS